MQPFIQHNSIFLFPIFQGYAVVGVGWGERNQLREEKSKLIRKKRQNRVKKTKKRMKQGEKSKDRKSKNI